MSHEPPRADASAEVIQEIETELERLLQKKITDVEKELDERITREREAAQKKKDEIEREFHAERQTVSDFRTMVKEVEEERGGLVEQARQHFDRVIHLQSEIETLAKSTVEEIRKVNGIQERLESLRETTAERAGFLKKDLQERFGIAAEVLDETPKTIDLDLDQELEKLRKIKELLAAEAATAGLGGPDIGPEEPLFPPPEAGVPSVKIPEIQDLIAASHAAEEEPAADEPVPAAPPEVPVPEPAPVETSPAVEESEEEIRAYLAPLKRSEPSDGGEEIMYFEKEGRIVLDGESLFSAVDKTLEEAHKLSQKLAATDSPKGQFFLKQELINWQEGLRGLFLRVIKMAEKQAWLLPSFTAEILNTAALRGLLERLSMGNWSNPDEFAAFSRDLAEMKRAFLVRVEARPAYFRSLKADLEPR